MSRSSVVCIIPAICVIKVHEHGKAVLHWTQYGTILLHTMLGPEYRLGLGAYSEIYSYHCWRKFLGDTTTTSVSKSPVRAPDD